MLRHTGTVPIESQRLLLRPFCEEDAQDMFDRWAGDEVVTRFLPWAPHRDVAITRDRIRQWVEQYTYDHVYHWAIVPHESGHVVGSISVQALRERTRACEIGYCIGRAFWNRGYATESLRVVLKLLFEQVGLHRVQALHHQQNPASGRVLEKAGMTREGILRDFAQDPDGSWYSLHLYSILEREWDA